MSEIASFLLDVPLDQSALATLYIFCHGSKMDTINIRRSDSVLPFSPPFIPILLDDRYFLEYIATKKYTSKKKYDHAIAVHPATGRQNIFLETTNPIELGARFANF